MRVREEETHLVLRKALGIGIYKAVLKRGDCGNSFRRGATNHDD
jgi:hypothetical protein